MGDFILLTGGTGFLGSHILESLVKNGHKVVVTFRAGSNDDKIKHLAGDYIPFLLDAGSGNIENLFENYRIDTVIHTATEYGRDSTISSVIETNVVFPLKLIEVGLKYRLRFFINTDSFFAKDKYQDSTYLNYYSKSKRMFRDLLVELSTKLNVANLCLEHVFGENDSEQKFVSNLFRKLILNTEEIKLTEGLQRRDFIYVEDAVSAFLKVFDNADQLIGFNEFEIGLGESVAVRDFVNAAAYISKSTSKLLFGVIENRPGEISDSSADITAIKRLGWKPIYTWKSAIEKVIEIERNKVK